MIRSMTIPINTLTTRNINACDCLTFNGTQIQSIRWKRKPIWLPPAKSKLFKIPVKIPLPPEEREEMQRLHRNYKTIMNSMRIYFIEKDMAAMEMCNAEAEESARKKDFEMSSYINEMWNKRVAAEREKRLAEERESRKEEILMKLKAKEERDLTILKRVEEKIKKAKEEAPTFITQENIDEAIENALNTVVNHNAAIDANGNFYTDLPKANAPSNVMK